MMDDSEMVGIVVGQTGSEGKKSNKDKEKKAKTKTKENNRKRDSEDKEESEKKAESDEQIQASRDVQQEKNSSTLMSDEDSDSDDDDDGKVEDEEVVPAEEQRTLGARERQRRGTVSLFEMVAADSGPHIIKRDGGFRKSDGESSNPPNAIARSNTQDDDSDDENEKADEAQSLRGRDSDAKPSDVTKETIKSKDKHNEQSPKLTKDRKKDKELQKERKEKERKEKEERDREGRERKEKERQEKLKEKERKREEKEKKKKEKKDKSLKLLQSTSSIIKSSDSSDQLKSSEPSTSSPSSPRQTKFEERGSSGDNDESVHVHTNAKDEGSAAADEPSNEENFGSDTPQARFKQMMSQKYASVSSDPAGYRTHMTMNYFSKLAEQRQLKRNREEAIKMLKALNPKDYQALKKSHERLLKEARDSRRRRVREGTLHSASPKDIPTRVASDLGPNDIEKEEELKSEEPSELSGSEGKQQSRRHKLNKRSRTMPSDMERGKGLRKSALTSEDSNDGNEGGKETGNEENNTNEDAKVKEEKEEAEEKPLSLRSSNSSPKSPLNPRVKKSNGVKEAASFDVEAFIDELYRVCGESPETSDDLTKYLFIKRLLREHELHKQERERRLKLTLGLQTSDNGSTLWKESDAIFHKPLTSFVCHRDFARLVRKYQIERPAGEILCGPFDKNQITKVDATYTVLATLAVALDDTEMADHIQTHFKLGYYFQNDDDLSDPTGLEKFFEEVIGANTSLMRILKVTSQSIVAPCITKLKACLAPLDFNSVRNSWSISIAIDSDEVTIVHTKQETATPDSEEKFGPFTFEWAIEYVFDQEMTSLKHMRPMLMNLRGSKKSRKAIKKAYAQLISIKAK